MQLDTNSSSNRTDPKSFFMYLLAIITLYASLFSFIALLFNYINLLFPDAVIQYSNAVVSVRWYIAILLVAYPAYLYITINIYKDILQHPEKIGLRIQKVLTYLTLFLTGIIILCDLITLIYHFLNGELTWRFILKVLAILVTFIWVYYFYIRDFHQRWRSSQLKLITSISTLIIIAILGYGILIAGSPFKARAAEFDQQRIMDLNQIQNGVIQYWQQKNKLPTSLAALMNSVTGFTAPMDPQSKKPYEYKVISKLSFKLCAEFNLPSVINTEQSASPHDVKSSSLPQETWNWQHSSGRYCFLRTIDPQIYKQ